MTKGRFCLVRDDDCRWFVIPEDRQSDWNEWVESGDWDTPPAFSTPIDNPHTLTFENFRA